MSTNPHLARLDALELKLDEIEASLSSDRLPPILANMRKHIARLEEQIAAQRAHPIEAELVSTDDAPVWTERINIDATVKDGYRVKEATVTVANAKGDEATREERRRRLAELIEDGQMVAHEMNRIRSLA